MMKKLALALTLVVGSCGWSGEEPAPVVQPRNVSSDSWDYYGSRGPGVAAPDPGGFEAALHGALIVPPDRAIVPLHARVPSETRAGAVERVRQIAEELRRRASSAPGCETTIHSLGHPEGGGDRYSASATLRMDVDLRGLDTPLARHERIEGCLAPLYDLPRSPFQGLELAVGEPRLTIDDPSAHRARLLEQRFAELSAVAALEAAPPQFSAARLACTSSGQVSIVERSLSGLRLAVDFSCAPRPVQAAPTSPAPVPAPEL